MTLAPFHLTGERLTLDPAGILAWPAQGLLAVADLHLEKGSHGAERGRFLPPYDTRETLSRLAPLVDCWQPRILILLGDSFHDPRGSDRLGGSEKAMLTLLFKGRRIVWVTGNHDPCSPVGLPGETVPQFRLGPLTFRHIAQPETSGEISGHYHPKATMPTRAGGITRPCFIADSRRVILPAFGSFCGGLDIGAPALSAIFPRGGRAFLLGRERLYSMPTGQHGAVRTPAVP